MDPGGLPRPVAKPWLEPCPALQESGPLESEAMVLGVLNQAFDVLVLRYGVHKRIYCNVSMWGASRPQLGTFWGGRGQLHGAYARQL